ncbi:lipopolysaccharide biosynthesis protein [Nocardioides sp.]|uniref:lipopolysaccharide biosynthesis protein n=1 Tax=Nocardioides sp. TaxID=35761 RepID=UPI002B264E3D|nr:polysaccharide biosynthesis C-terminal domain-containing protein [Nocardioides sp.]
MSEPHATHDTLRELGRGAALGLAGSVFAAGVAFALAIAVARGLSPEEAGRFFTATSLFALLVAATCFGTEAGLARFLLRLEAAGEHGSVRRAIGWAAGPTIGAACVVSVLLLASAERMGSLLGLGPDGPRVVVCLAVALPTAVAAEVLLGSTRGFGHILPTVVADRIVRAGLQGVLALTIVAAGGGLVVVTAGWVGAYVVSAALALVWAARVVHRRGPRAGVELVGSGAPEPALGRRFWSFTWPRGVGALAQMGIQKSDIVIIALLLTPVDAALYAVATRFVPLGQMAVQALQQVLQPRLTGLLVGGDPAALATVFRTATSWSILLAWPIYLVVLCAPSTYLGVFGGSYASAAPVVVLLASAMLVAVATGPVDTLLLMSGRSRLSMTNALVALGIDLVLCVLLVPRWGIAGAAVAWAIAVLVRCGLATFQVRRQFALAPDRHALRTALLPVACFGVPVLASSPLGLDLGGLLVTVVAGGSVYLVVLAHLRVPLALDLVVPHRRSVAATHVIHPAEESDSSCALDTPCVR